VGRLIPAEGGRKLAQWYGIPMLLLSCVPFIGDATCVASGRLRLRWRPATPVIAAAWLARYVVVAEDDRGPRGSGAFPAAHVAEAIAMRRLDAPATVRT
jgi:hypothetical protein